jgi:RND family efflux transporter MFP subunit
MVSKIGRLSDPWLTFMNLSLLADALKTPLALIVASLLLTACQKTPEAEPVPRPVRTLLVQSAPVQTRLEFPAEVRARVESKLGFRVSGKLLERRVEVGQSVKQGQLLARLDASDFMLQAQASQAQLQAAATERDLARADFARFEDLYQKNFISKAELDRRRSQWDAAQARWDQAQANLSLQTRQTAYAELRAPAAGVITAVEAEPGQVVTPGQSIFRLALTGQQDKEVVIQAPEDQVQLLRQVKTAEISFWAIPGKTFAASLREVAPSADPATRSYSVKYTLAQQTTDIKLGMSANAALALPATSSLLRLPLTALVEKEGKTFVWVVDEKTSRVQENPVQVAGPSGVEVLIAAGLKPGQRVVTAGAHLMQSGLKVKLLDKTL